ncbi:hypothetical protein A6R74_12345 [Halomonas sp. ALS9]|nr:hypothetical protein A6R74_12345 [Halomonas sp. ALS9]
MVYASMALTVRQINSTKPSTKILALSDGQGLELRIWPNAANQPRHRFALLSRVRRRLTTRYETHRFSLVHIPVARGNEEREFSERS